MLTTKISEADKSVIVSLPASILKVSEPAPPVMISLPAPPVMMSTPPPPMMVSTPAPPIMVSTPSLPVIVKPSVCALKLTLEPAVFASTVSIFLKFVSDENTCEPADNCRVSAPPAPSKTSRFPCPEDATVNVSSPLPPVRLFIPEPLIILYPPPLDKDKSIDPVSLAVNDTVPVSYTHLTLPTKA